MKIVVVMPFDQRFDPVYSAIKTLATDPAQQFASSEGVVCVRVDEDLRAARITGKIDQQLRSADLCIADLTDLHPNVLWEVGFAEALQKPLIAITQSPVELLPFNIKDLSVIQYADDRLEESLTQPLGEAIRQTAATRAAQRGTWTIAITGSSSINPKSATMMVQTFAAPFLGPDTTWYCDTDTTVSEAAARYLLGQHQRVVGVYTSNHRVLPEIRALFESASVPLLNVDEVVLPRGLPELGRRNSFLVVKSDLVILIWDGQSENTKQLHDWLTLHNKNHLVGFTS